MRLTDAYLRIILVGHRFFCGCSDTSNCVTREPENSGATVNASSGVSDAAKASVQELDTPLNSITQLATVRSEIVRGTGKALLH